MTEESTKEKVQGWIKYEMNMFRVFSAKCTFEERFEDLKELDYAARKAVAHYNNKKNGATSKAAFHAFKDFADKIWMVQKWWYDYVDLQKTRFPKKYASEIMDLLEHSKRYLFKMEKDWGNLRSHLPYASETDYRNLRKFLPQLISKIDETLLVILPQQIGLTDELKKLAPKSEPDYTRERACKKKPKKRLRPMSPEYDNIKTPSSKDSKSFLSWLFSFIRE